jgi:hypothetical protein
VRFVAQIDSDNSAKCEINWMASTQGVIATQLRGEYHSFLPLIFTWVDSRD